jgi:N-acetylmuramoyl-L-alanine amidase
MRTTLPSQWQPSPNYSARRPSLVVVHHTGSASVDRALATLTDPGRGVSAHYLIARDGRILQLVDERMRAWHAGESRWGNESDVNSASIGIELDNDGDEPFPRPQIDALLRLLADVTARHRIAGTNVVGHADVAPGRKTDPSAWFPWGELAGRGFGLWCDEPLTSPTLQSMTIDVPLGLRAIGYDTSDPDSALRAFRIHYAGVPGVGRDDGVERALLECLVRRSAEAAADGR